MDDDNLVGEMVSTCRHIMREYPTLSRMTACFNLTAGIVRLFTVSCEKQTVMDLIDDFHAGLKKEVEDMYKDE